MMMILWLKRESWNHKVLTLKGVGVSEECIRYSHCTVPVNCVFIYYFEHFYSCVRTYCCFWLYVGNHLWQNWASSCTEDLEKW